jgi:hypothetical protein
VFIPVVPLVKELELTIGRGKRFCVHREVLRKPMGLEPRKWGLCIHKGAVL